MKSIQNIYIVFLAFFMGSVLFSCSDEDNSATDKGKGTLVVSLKTDDTVLTRSDEVIDMEQILLKIQRVDIANQPVMEYTLSSEGSFEEEFDAGEYKLTAIVGNEYDPKEGPTTTPYYKGYENVTLESGKPTFKNIICQLTTAVIEVDYDDIRDAYSGLEYKTVVSTAGGEGVSFYNTEEGEKGVSGYFVPGDLSVVFSYKNGDWIEIPMDDIEEAKLEPQYKYIIKYTLKDDGENSSGSAGIGVIVDDPEKQEGTIIIKLPKLTSYIDLINIDLEILEAHIFGTYHINNGVELSDDILEYCQLSDFGTEGEWFDLEIENRNETTFKAVWQNLQADKKYKVRFKKDIDVFKTFSTSRMTYESIGRSNIWASFVRNVKVNYNEVAETFKYQYREVGETEWIDSSTDEFIPEGNFWVSNLKFKGSPDYQPEYEYRLVAISENINIYGNIASSFVAEKAAKLPNSSFEGWSTEKGSNGISSNASWTIPNAEGEAKFWDCGNRGSSALSNVLTGSDTEHAITGNYAAKLESKQVGGNSLGRFAAGNLFVGEFVEVLIKGVIYGASAGGRLNFGREFASRPTALRFWFQYTNGGNIKVDSKVTIPADLVADGAVKDAPDKANIYIALSDKGAPYEIVNSNTKGDTLSYFDKNDDNIIAYGEWTQTDTTTEMAEFTIDLDYRSYDRIPTHIIIVCSSSKYGDYFTGAAGSILYLDDFELIYDVPEALK